MSLQMILVLVILASVILLFLTGWVRMEVVPILVPFALVVANLVRPEEVFTGFSSSAVITVASLFVISDGLVRSGIVQRISDFLRSFTGESGIRLLLASTFLPGIIAGFMIVTATVFLFAPTVMRMALHSGLPRERLLLPLAATCLLGANLTLIGASHNLVVNSLLQQSAGVSFSFFELMPLGLALLGAAVLYNLLFGARLLPAGPGRQAKSSVDWGDNLVRVYNLQDRLWELWVKKKSPAEGNSPRDIGLGERYGLSLIAIVRGQEQLPAEEKEEPLQEDDVLLVLGREEKVDRLAQREGLVIAGHPREQVAFPLSSAELVELVVPPRSPVIGKTLSELNFREETGLSGLALWRGGRPWRTDVGSQPLREGDGLLLYGSRHKTRSFQPGDSFRWLQPPREEEAPHELRHLGPYALLLLFLVIGSAALGWLPIAVAALSGAAGMIILGILTPRQAYEIIDWRTIVLIGGLYPLGIAMENSGTSALLAAKLIDTLYFLGPTGVLFGVAFFSMLLTQPLYNVAAAVIMTPVAFEAAQALGGNPKAYAAAVIAGVSAAFLMPVGHPAPLLVQHLGGYSARDYLRFGLGLCLLVLLIIVFLVPRIWP